MTGFGKKSKKGIVIFALVFALSSVFVVQHVYAYFTTYATAEGSVPVYLEHKTEIHEQYADWKKTISLENTGEVPVFVRVKVICGSQFTVKASGDKWTYNQDGFYYYSDVLAVGATTTDIIAAIEKSPDVVSDFNIIVVQECTPAMCDENGNMYIPENADWKMQAKYRVD